MSEQSLLMTTDANSIYNSKRMGTEQTEALQQLATKDMYAIQEIANEPNLFHLICNSICPAIFGHEAVKGTPLSISCM